MDGQIVQTKTDAGVLRIDLFNLIDETVPLPEIPNDLSRVLVNFNRVTFINSKGIMNWIRWLKTVQTKNSKMVIELVDLSMAYLRALEMIPDVLPGSAVVSSMFYYFFCEKCGEEDSLLESNAKAATVPVKVCAKCGGTMELEMSPEVYKTIARQAP